MGLIYGSNLVAKNVLFQKNNVFKGVHNLVTSKDNTKHICER